MKSQGLTRSLAPFLRGQTPAWPTRRLAPFLWEVAAGATGDAGARCSLCVCDNRLPRQAMAGMDTSCEKYNIPKDIEFKKQFDELLNDLWEIFAMGLLFHAFRSAKEKRGLRDQVMKALSLCQGKKVDKASFPASLADQVRGRLEVQGRSVSAVGSAWG